MHEDREDREAFKSGATQNRFVRFGKQFWVEVRGEVRQLIMILKIWLWPTYLWSDAVNICKLIHRIGTRENKTFRKD